MAAEDAVLVAANAREQVRLSLERMEYHLGRGARGVRGVQREVAYLDALSRQSARLGQQTAGAIRQAGGQQGLGQRALAALSGGDSVSRGRTKSSLLATFSDDTMYGAREFTYLNNQQWVWRANASACAACINNHGNVFSGGFVPEHPSCLCYPVTPAEAAANGITALSEQDVLGVLRASNNPRFRAQAQAVDQGRLSYQDIVAINSRPNTGVFYRQTLTNLQQGGAVPIPQVPPERLAQTNRAAQSVADDAAQAVDDVAALGDEFGYLADDFVDLASDEEAIIAAMERYKFRYNSQTVPKSKTGGDEFLEDLYRQRNYHNKPTRLDPDDFLNQEGGTTLFRGVPERRFIDDYIEATDHRGGYGIYGQGTYSAAAPGTSFPAGSSFPNAAAIETAGAYAENSGHIMAIKLKPGARIADYNELKDLTIRMRNASTDPTVNAVAGDPSYLAVALGYDAVFVPGSNYMVILNRGATYVTDTVSDALAAIGRL